MLSTVFSNVYVFSFIRSFCGNFVHNLIFHLRVMVGRIIMVGQLVQMKTKDASRVKNGKFFKALIC